MLIKSCYLASNMDIFIAGLDEKIREIETAEKKVSKAVAAANEKLEELKKQIRGRVSTGDKLQDWALVQHGLDYKRYVTFAHAVQNYLERNSGQLVALLNRSSTGIGHSEERLSVGVLASDTLEVRRTSDEFHLAISLISQAGLLVEQRDGEFRSKGNYLATSDIYTARGAVLILTSPKHFFDPDGLRFRPSVDYFEYSATSSMKGSKLIAGEANVTKFLRDDFWKAGHTPSSSYRGPDMSRVPSGGGRFYPEVPPPEARPFFERVGISFSPPQ